MNLLGSLVLTEAKLVSVTEAGPEFRVLRLSGLPEASFQAGDKIQLVLPDRDVRTFTPVYWSPGGESELFVHMHADSTPATRWARSLAAGDRLRFVGPQRSLRMPEGPLLLIGDETSIAVAAAYARARSGKVRAIFEVDAKVDVDTILAAAGLQDALVVRRGREAADTALLEVLADTGSVHFYGGARVGITGSGALVQRARAALRKAGSKDITVKPYWLAGRSGLD